MPALPRPACSTGESPVDLFRHRRNQIQISLKYSFHVRLSRGALPFTQVEYVMEWRCVQSESLQELIAGMAKRVRRLVAHGNQCVAE
jgi:hypothetical protein